jgi:superfamily II DNA helicase RecQ
MNIKVFNIRLHKEYFDTDQVKMNDFLDGVEVKLTSANFVTTGSTDYWSAVVFYMPKTTAASKEDVEALTENETKIFNTLRTWRNDLAQKLDWTAFRICHNSHLIAIAKANPQTIDELKKIKSFGELRTEKYGDDIIAVLNAL